MDTDNNVLWHELMTIITLFVYCVTYRLIKHSMSNMKASLRTPKCMLLLGRFNDEIL